MEAEQLRCARHTGQARTSSSRVLARPHASPKESTPKHIHGHKLCATERSSRASPYHAPKSPNISYRKRPGYAPDPILTPFRVPAQGHAHPA